MKFELRTNDTLKCSACGNKDFHQKHLQKDGHDKWVYVCEHCGHIMAFADALVEKKGLMDKITG